jgi:hypothetical protein
MMPLQPCDVCRCLLFVASEVGPRSLAVQHFSDLTVKLAGRIAPSEDSLRHRRPLSTSVLAPSNDRQTKHHDFSQNRLFPRSPDKIIRTGLSSYRKWTETGRSDNDQVKIR